MSKTRPYVGPDRRSPVPPGQHPRGTRWVLIGVLLGIVGWAGLVLVGSSEIIDNLAQLARSLAAALFLTAAGVRFATWRITGEALAAWGAIGLTLLGVTLCFVSVLGIVEGTSDGVATVPGRQLLMLVAVALLLIGAFGPEIQAGLRPARVAFLVTGTALVLAVVIAGRTSVRLPRELMLTLANGAAWTVAVLWAWVAVRHLHSGIRYRRTTEQWAGAGLAFMAVSELLRVCGVFGDRSWVLAAGLHLVAAAVLLAASATRLSEVLAVTGTKTLRLAGDLQHVRDDLVTIERVQHQRLHDASTAVVSVIGASKLLFEPVPGNEIDSTRLHRMMTAELDRLRAVLAPEQQGPDGDFDLAELLDPLILAHRIAGAEITVDLHCVRAHGNPAAFATAVANVLTNARTHAPGTPITIGSQTDGERVTVTVSDAGPGIAAVDRSRVLEHGVRGVDSPGSGIGLHTASAAMHRQGGSLALESGDRGGTAVVLTLPVATEKVAMPGRIPLPDPTRPVHRTGV